MPSLPPIDVEVARGRLSGYEPGRPSYRFDPYEYEPAAEAEDEYAAYEEAEEPGFDIYGLVLGVLAAVAVLGLIPLWITVYLTLTR